MESVKDSWAKPVSTMASDAAQNVVAEPKYASALTTDPLSLVYDPVCGSGNYILTPQAPAIPLIHGPSVFGVRPGSPFLYTIPATGVRPVVFSAEGLPAGLRLEASTGLIRGTIEDETERDYEVIFHVQNSAGNAEKAFRIRVGETICLTPPLGWNSWNCWKGRVSQEHVLASAQAMVEKGLVNFGWSYINVDDAWQGQRGGRFNAIQGDSGKFPDIEQMCATIHAMGLKVGIYSTPWVTTYAGYCGGSSNHADGRWSRDVHAPPDYRHKEAFWGIGQYHFEQQDAAQWAEWGIDYLKYDWRPNDPPSTIRMAEALRKSGRDIIYSLSNAAPLEHAELYGQVANCWRTAGDLKGRWNQEGWHLNILEQWDAHRNWIETGVRGGPGHFPDADMLVVGDLVSETDQDGALVPTKLTADEQYSHISLWALWGCPMLIGCPIETMDDFTLNLLTNAEVLDVHQDELAQAGRSIILGPDIEIVVKELRGGRKAVGLFNKSDKLQTIGLELDRIGIQVPCMIRDLWRQLDVGIFSEQFEAVVRPHGVVFIGIDLA